MALNIKDESVHEMVKKIAALTGESQSRAVSVAVAERLQKLELNSNVARVMDIARSIASRLPEDFKALDHGDLLYDEKGLPT